MIFKEYPINDKTVARQKALSRDANIVYNIMNNVSCEVGGNYLSINIQTIKDYINIFKLNIRLSNQKIINIFKEIKHNQLIDVIATKDQQHQKLNRIANNTDLPF